MKKTLLYIVAMTLTLAVVFTVVGFIVFGKLDESVNKEVEINEDESKSTKDEFEEVEELEQKKLNPFGEDKDLENLSSNDYANYIHGMSHQKVQAEDKWINYEMTQDRIVWLLEGLESSQEPNVEIYKEILERWKVGDFSRADEDHNAVWSIQGGNVGKANGLLNASEEEKFVQEKYR